MTLTLRSPHAVLAALESRAADVLEVRLPEGRAHGAWRDVESAARAAGRPVRTTVRQRQDPRAEGRRGGAEADVRERADVDLDVMFRAPRSGDLWIALDSIQDPHNVGAIFRTAAFFGVRGIVTTQDRAAPLTSVVYDVASGGVEVVPFAVETNLRRALDAAKHAGAWILGTSEHAEAGLDSVSADRPWLVVLGNEETGLRRLTLEACDVVVRIAPRATAVTSLNVSVAAGILVAALRGQGPPGSTPHVDATAQ